MEAPRGRAAPAAGSGDPTWAVATVDLPRRVRNFIVAALIASFVLTAGPGLLGGRETDLAMVYGTHTLAFVLLTVAVGLLLGCRSSG